MSKSLMLPVLAGGLLLAASAASAQGVPFGQIDANHDGVLSAEEVNATFGPAAEEWFSQANRNGDEFISRDEVRPSRGNHDNPGRGFAQRLAHALRLKPATAQGGNDVAELARDNPQGVSRIAREPGGGQVIAGMVRQDGAQDTDTGTEPQDGAQETDTGMETQDDGQVNDTGMEQGSTQPIAAIARQEGGQTVAGMATSAPRAVATAAREAGQARAAAARESGQTRAAAGGENGQGQAD